MSFTEEQLMEAIATAEHPEIGCTLCQLGMIRNVELVPDSDRFVFTLVVPMFGIPTQIRDALIHRVYQAGRSVGAELDGVYVVEMDDAERTHFFEMARQNWKLDGDAPCQPPAEREQ